MTASSAGWTRNRVPHDAHADLYRSQVRPDPLRLVLEQDQGRLPSLIPCGASGCPPTHQYFRGSDVVMAADLAVTPVSEINVQASGDVDVLSFGYYLPPDGAPVFDVGYFDETLRAPGSGTSSGWPPAWPSRWGTGGAARTSEWLRGLRSKATGEEWRGRPGRTG